MQRRAALYARFSTELQAERSVDDQLDLCAAFAEQQGCVVVGRYADRARSGTTTFGRDGLSSLVSDARAGSFEVVIVEALDRLSRDQEDLAGLHKRLSFLGIEIIAVHDGRADALQVGIRGLVSSLWIADLKHKIRRGMGGRVKDGKAAGGRAYGYRPTPGDPGRPVIHEAEAAVIRRIFTETIAGRTPRDIAAGLNADAIPAPRGIRWNASTINGNGQRGHGILRNPLYSGRLVWNRVRMVRDPDTGKRISRPNPPSEWQETAVPELAIIDAETWAKVNGIRGDRGHGTHTRKMDRRGRPLSGLLRCGRCGGGMAVHDTRAGLTRVRCSVQRESGSCDNRRYYSLNAIENAVITGIAQNLRHPDGVRKWLEDQQAERRAGSAARARLEREAHMIRERIDRMARMLVDGRVPEDFFDAEMPKARADLAALEDRLAAAPAHQVVELHPATLASYAEVLDGLSDMIRSMKPGDSPEVVAALRGLIDRVTVFDGPDGTVHCEVVGPLTPLVGPLGGLAVAEVRLSTFPPMQWGRFCA